MSTNHAISPFSIPTWLAQTGHVATHFLSRNGQGVRVMLIDAALHDPYFLTANHTHNALHYHIPYPQFTPSFSDAIATHADASVSLLLGYEGQLQGLIPAAEVHLVQAIYRQHRQATIRAVHRALLLALTLAVHIVIMPFGTRYAYPHLQSLLTQLAAKEVLLLAAAGNYGEQSLCYPALYPQVKAVSAWDKQGKVLPFCAAHDYVDQYLPAEDVPCIQQGRVHPMSGSSVAVVLAGGLAALAHHEAVQ